MKTASPEPRLEYVAINDLQKWPGNPKQHDIDGLADSIRRFGFRGAVIIDERTGKIVAGHGRSEAVAKIRDAGGEVPKFVRVGPNGDWQIPVLRGTEFESEAEAEKFLIADNRFVELGGWDDSALREMLGRIDDIDVFRLLDFEVPTLKLEKIPTPPSIPTTSPAVVAQQRWNVERGQTWIMGKHRLRCGDSTNAEDVAALMKGAKPGMMVTDPPYGVEYDASWRQDSGLTNGTKKMGGVYNDDRADWKAAYELFPGDVAYVYHAGLHSHTVRQNLVDVGFEIRSQIIWAKDRFAISRGDYHWQHEPCWYAVRAGRTGRRTDDRTQSTLWTIPARDDDGHGHSTQKPIECMARAMRNHDFDAVYEPFSGSGTTLIAAEKLHRSCYAMEIAPEYVATAIERWVAITGETPRIE